MRMPIAITGVGVVSPAGTSADALWNSLAGQEDRRGRWPKRELKGYPVDSVISIPEDLWHALGGPKGHENRARALAEFAVTRALEDARLSADETRVGCLLGTTTAGVEMTENSVLALANGQTAPADLDGSAVVPSRHRWAGPTGMISTACSSSLISLALAADALAAGEADAMIAGGVDVLLEYTICGFNALRLATDDRCRPFSAGRRGVVLSEGVACFCLEPLSAARARGAEIRAVINGYGISCDADHVTAPNAEGVARAVRQVLESSGIAPAAIGGIFAHGTGTPTNDESEVAALRAAFGDTALPPITAIKSVLGHPQAAAGAMSLVAALLALEKAQLPATAGLEAIDPALGGVAIVNDGGQTLAQKNLLVNAFGFGGNNCVMLISDAETADGVRGRAA